MQFLVTLFFFLLLSIPQLTHADVSFTISPLVIEADVTPRDIITREITLTNTGTTPVTIFPTVNNITLDEGGAIQEFVPQVMSDQTTSLAAWMEISRAGIDLRVGETKKATLTLRINPGAQPGEYHALLGFPHGEHRDEAEKKITQGKAQGVIVSATIQDNKKTVLKIARFIVDRFVFQRENSAASFTMRNPGDEAVVPEGEILFYNMKGEEIAAVPVNKEKKSLQPGEEYTFIHGVPLEDLFGKYKAFLSVEYGNVNKASLQDTAFFYAFPLSVLLSILGVFIFIAAFIAFHIHKKYIDDNSHDGAELLTVHIRDRKEHNEHEHDINLKQQ